MEDPKPTLNRFPAKAPAPGMSLAARLLNVFAVPGAVFGELKLAPPAISNWLVPVLLGAIVGVIYAFIILSQASVQKQFQDRQTAIMDDAMKSGKLSAQDRKTAEKLTNPTSLKIFGAAGAVAGSFGNALWWGFVLWFSARRVLKVPVPFGKALEVSGLSMMINVLSLIVTVLLIVNFGRSSAPNLEVIAKDFDMTRKGHLFLAAANVFSFWVVGVLSVGLAKLADVPYLRAAWLVLTFWVLEQSFLVISGVGQLAM
jgi:hypothetical protein